MKLLLKSAVMTALACVAFTIHTQAQEVTPKELKVAFAPKGTHRTPFKKATEAELLSVNLQFKLATREEQEKRKVGNIITWGFLDGIEDNILQEIANEYYKNLETKFKANGISLTNEYKESEQYQKLIERSADLSREVESKGWGISQIVTANNGPYIEFPITAGPHAALGNKLKKPVGILFVTVDFIEITQNISKGISSFTLMDGSSRTDKFETDMRPVIRIDGVTQVGKMRGDGSYARFNGDNWSYCNPSLQNYAITSAVPYADDVQVAEELPERMKKFKSAVMGDLVSIFSRGAVKSGRGNLEATYTIKANPQAYKKAVLDALDKYNNYLIAYIKANN